MAPPDMTRASDTQDQEGARRPGIRGWFQPAAPPAAAAHSDDGEETETVPPHQADGNGQGSGGGSGDAPAQVQDETTVFPRIPADEAGVPDETTVLPRILGTDAAAPAAEPGDDELPAADQAPAGTESTEAASTEP